MGLTDSSQDKSDDSSNRPNFLPTHLSSSQDDDQQADIRKQELRNLQKRLGRRP